MLKAFKHYFYCSTKKCSFVTHSQKCPQKIPDKFLLFVFIPGP